MRRLSRERQGAAAARALSAPTTTRCGPRGDLIAFTRFAWSYGSGVDGTYVVRADGSGLAKISGATMFSWAPDGQELVVGGIRGLEVIDTTGRVLRGLTNEREDASPAWSPDGRLIALRRSGGIWAIPAEGGTPSLITRDRLPLYLIGAQRLSWSPDSTRLAYVATRVLRNRTDYELHVVDVDGAPDRILASGVAFQGPAAWAPDGSRVAFASARGSQRDLFVVDLADGNVSTLTRSRGWEAHPSWSPDGESIAFVRRDGLFVVAVAGGASRKVSGFPEARDPHWSPDGSRLAFSGRGDCLRGGIVAVPASGGAPDRLSNDCRIYGTEAPDRLTGTWDRDIVYGRGGNDVISLGGSSDVGYGEGGDDVIRGGRWNDVLVGGPGKDTLIGDRGNDRLWAADGEVDELRCGAQVDRVVADRRDRIARDCERVRRRK